VPSWLPYLHPIWQTFVLALGIYVLRIGFMFAAPPDIWAERSFSRSQLRRKHTRLALCFLGVVAIGSVGGVVEIVWVRQLAPLDSAHGLFAVTSVALFALTRFFGARLNSRVGDSAARELHRFCAALAMLAALGSAVSGFALLP